MGEYRPSLDEKGRVAIPAKLRKAFGEEALIDRLIVTYGFDRYIMAYREEDWERFVKEKLVEASDAHPDKGMIMRYFVGGAFDCELDKQGRIIIPSYLKEHAQIDRDVTILGLYNRIEIWGTELYNKNKPSGDALNVFARDLGF